MTQEEFNQLPMLLSAGRVRLVLGCEKEKLTQLRAAYPELAMRMRGMKHYRYRKIVLAKIIGLGV